MITITDCENTGKLPIYFVFVKKQFSRFVKGFICLFSIFITGFSRKL